MLPNNIDNWQLRPRVELLEVDWSGLPELLKGMDMDEDRIQLVQIAHGDKTGFQAAIDKFMETLNKLGPLNHR